MIKFAGIRSDEMNLIVEHYPQKVFPERSYEVLEVPGRDGDIVIDNGNFKNYRQSYSVFIDSNDPDEAYYQRVSSKIAEWLLSNPGYQRLEDSYDPEFYRMAYYSGGSNFSNFFNTYGRGTIEFTCAPRRFYKSGDEARIVGDETILYSPSKFPSDPIYEIQPSSTTPAISINANVMQFSIASTSYPIIVDVQKHTAMAGGQRVQIVSDGIHDVSYEDLKLYRENMIAYSGVSSLKITPRWWTL